MTVMRERLKLYEEVLKAVADKLNVDLSAFLY
jgi:hypothetical protein